MFSALTVERTSFHRYGRNCVLGKFPLVLVTEESNQAVPVPVEDEQQLEDILRWPPAEGMRDCGEMEVEDVSGGCM